MDLKTEAITSSKMYWDLKSKLKQAEAKGDYELVSNLYIDLNRLKIKQLEMFGVAHDIEISIAGIISLVEKVLLETNFEATGLDL